MWIRSGAPLQQGVSLYTSVSQNTRLVAALHKNPAAYEKEMALDICDILGITYAKFQSIITKYHGTKKQPASGTGSINKKITRENRPKKRQGTFRQDWPFLSDAKCPPELKALAADKISCWERYTANHAKLFDCSSLEECSDIAHEIIKDYKENRLIYQEFEHYQKNGKILGLHPVFAHYKRFEKLRGLNVIDLVKEQERVKHRLWRINSEIEKGDKPHLREKREQSRKETEGELAEINRMLGIK